MIDKMAKDAGVSKAAAGKALTAFTKAVAEPLKKG
jgi:nucleoid DNA-binding protein